jgi:hypothetical protein
MLCEWINYSRDLGFTGWADFLSNAESSASHNPIGLHGLLQGQLYFLTFLYSKVNPDTENLRGLNLVAVKHTTVQVLGCCCSVSYKLWNMICCTEPVLTRPCIYCMYIKHVTCKEEEEEEKENLTMDNYCWQGLTRDTRPLVREGAPQRQDGKFQTELISGRKSHSGLDTKMYWLTDRQS